MAKVAFRLSDNSDPEERLEEAALWKAMSDFYGEDIVPLRGKEEIALEVPVFGRGLKFPHADQNPVPSRLDYWNDPAFLRYCRRDFHVASYEDAKIIVKRKQTAGSGVFLKSTAMKHFKVALGPHDDFDAKIGDMVYSFIDGGPDLMVQDLCQMEYEHRLFVIDNEVVTFSPNMVRLTPLDHPLKLGTVYRKTDDVFPQWEPQIAKSLIDFGHKVARETEYRHVVIDVAMIKGAAGWKPGVVEFNPMQLGQIGLFAADVRKLAAASRILVEEYVPAKPFSFTQEPDQGFSDLAP